MSIAPVSPVSFKNNYAPLNFGSKKNNTEGCEYTPSQKRGATDLAKMPVVVLLAMTPAMADAVTPATFESENLPVIEVTDNDIPETDAMTYILTPKVQETQQSTAPYGWECLNHENINYACKFKADNKIYNLLFTASGNHNSASSVYIIPSDSKGSKKSTDIPPEVRQLRHHDIGEGEYCGAIIDTEVRAEDTGKYMGTHRHEMKLPDEVAQKIVDLVTGHSDFKNNTQINIKTVNTKELAPTKFYE